MALAGCIGDDGVFSENNPSRPTEITDIEFETDVTVDDGYSKPIITVNRQTATVTVEGVGEYGSSRCGYLDYHVEYRRVNSLLEVTIVAEKDEPEEGETSCEDDVSASAYRIVTKFDDGVPSRIEAEHPFEKGATKEVDSV